jgi:2-methylcitrate dehydratase PrpD
MPSLGRQFAEWAAALRYEDLPPEVADRARSVTLHALSSALIGYGRDEAKSSLVMMREEEAGGGGSATVLVDGSKLTKAGAVFVNAEMTFAGGKWDTFRMLTHPGCAIVPAALVAAEEKGVTGKELITGIVAGYEVMERMASEFIPTVMTRGFHAGPVFAIFGAAVAAAKIGRLNADQIDTTISQCVNLAGGNLQGVVSGGKGLREGGAVRNALLAVALGRNGVTAGDFSLEGEAGFYHSYAGNNLGRLTYSFTGKNRVDLASITEGLGRDWMFLETLFRIYTTPGYNIAHVDVTAALCCEHDIKPEDVDHVEAVVNWLETMYPSPAFPVRYLDAEAKPETPHYYVAYGIVERGFPVTKDRARGLGEPDNPRVLELMQRVNVTGAHCQTLFGPKITIHLKDGRSFTREGSGREFIWDFKEEERRIRGVVPDLPIPGDQFDELIAACSHLERLDSAARTLIELTVIPPLDVN